MDLLPELIRLLHAEKRKIEQAIAALEALQVDSADPISSSFRRRGRKSMSAKEREQVSARMKQYWADRRRSRRMQPRFMEAQSG